MKTKLLTLSTMLLLSSNVAMASDDSMLSGKQYMGLKVGQTIEHGINQTSDFKKDDYEIEAPMVYGFYFVQETPLGIGFEADIVVNSEADIKEKDKVIGTISSYRYGTYISGAYNLTDAFYAKAKVGYVRHTSTLESNINGRTFEAAEGGLGLGAAVGMAISNSMGIQAEYTYTDTVEKSSDATLGLHLKF